MNFSFFYDGIFLVIIFILYLKNVVKNHKNRPNVLTSRVFNFFEIGLTIKKLKSCNSSTISAISACHPTSRQASKQCLQPRSENILAETFLINPPLFPLYPMVSGVAWYLCVCEELHFMYWCMVYGSKGRVYLKLSNINVRYILGQFVRNV